MNKRIVISESEKQRILSQHKGVIKEESELKRQSLSEREMSKLINSVLINESNACKADSDCGRGQRCVNGKCSITTSLKEMRQCKSDTDCPSNMACYNGKCQVTSKSKEMKEGAGCKTNRDCGGLICSNGQCVNRFTKSEMKEARKCRPGEQECGGGCCPRGSSCRLGMCSSGASQPTPPIFNESEEMDEGSTKPTSTPSKVPGCMGGMTYCASAKQCCESGGCDSYGCRDPRTGRRVPGGRPIDESDEIIYEIEMDVEEIDETIYEIELDDEKSKIKPKKRGGCCTKFKCLGGQSCNQETCVCYRPTF
jgi:hypothetical protein